MPGTVDEGPTLLAWLASPVPKASLEGNPGQSPRVRGVCTNPGCLWKGLRVRFFRLYDRARARIPADLPHTCQKFHKRPACGNKTEAKRHFGEERHGPNPGPCF